MYPIFFSVSSKDIEFAEATWQKFPDDWVYLYSKTGRHGVHMWDEIALTELPNAKVMVIFWSRNFPESTGCIREIKQAVSLYRLGSHIPLILRLDDYPLSWRDGICEDQKPVFEALKPLADYRASDPDVSVEKAKALISQVAEPLLESEHPRMPRHDMVKALRKVLEKDRFSLVPTCWVSGFNGVGREALVRSMNRDLLPNGLGFVLEVNEAMLPRQLYLRIESEAFGADVARLKHLSEASDDNDLQLIADAVDRISANGNFLILRHTRLVQESVELPEWIDDVAAKLRPETRSKLFIISQLPLMGQRLVKCRDFVVPFRVSTVDENQMVEFCYQLIGHFDNNPHRWREDDVLRIVRAAGGTVGFLVSLVRSASRIESFDDIEVMLAQEDERMAESITVYLDWAFSQLKGNAEEQKTLIFLNDVSPCHIADLEAIVQPAESMLRVLSRLIGLGLVERETDDLYRLTPLLARRLSTTLIRPELIKWVEEAQRSFASTPFEAISSNERGEHEYIRLESKIQAGLLSGSVDLPDIAYGFVSAAHWFQAGIRLYHARKFKPAFSLLKKAHEKRDHFRDASRMEIDRYFCLAATRMRKYLLAESCIQRLSSDYRNKPIAAFLRADLLEYKRQFPEAIQKYEEALRLNSGKDRRREFIYRPLIRCILKSNNPDFERAARIAKDYVDLKRTVFSLFSLARVYLEWKYLGPKAKREVPTNIDDLYRDALCNLEDHTGAGAAPFELYAEEAKFSGDFDSALDHMNQAVRMAPDRFQLRDARWRLMVETGRNDLSAMVVEELNNARNNQAYDAIWPSYIGSLAETYARALRQSGKSVALLNGFAPEMQGTGELGSIIARSRMIR
ncbi:hypothetical protein C8N35_101395 [Breoghania corrubedonensis]|uniref:TIR domain-containing protein n=1 Tax=Breoghania corrubedonensis TaxID=665038 RepID=A0A2T5VF19_9HYPH|nr:toll/interleukin-1 receptor domain-containing protein [Breoghania corrubedonensis]PTW62353.1 hypothetical protein C8N35_101395 [Breoghania corrubedonensis]